MSFGTLNLTDSISKFKRNSLRFKCVVFFIVILLFNLNKISECLNDEDDEDVSLSDFSLVDFTDDLVINNETLLVKSTNEIRSAFNLFGIKCKSDANCASSKGVCLNGSCVRVCSQHEISSDCVFIHCDGKLTILSNETNIEKASYGNDDVSIDQAIDQTLRRTLIETNNYPTLNSYLKNKKCSWILKNLNYENKNGESKTSSGHLPFIQLSFQRFSTEFGIDFLYIFAGDSIFSPLIAALR